MTAVPGASAPSGATAVTRPDATSFVSAGTSWTCRPRATSSACTSVTGRPTRSAAATATVDGGAGVDVAVLDREIEATRADDLVAARFFAKMGGYAPTIGIIGTVVGLVQVLKNLEDPKVLGPLVASAFVATLWGVLSANFIWLPMSVKIRRNADLRKAQMELILEGVCEILAGTNPRALRDKLRAMLPPSEAQLSAA